MTKIVHIFLVIIAILAGSSSSFAAFEMTPSIEIQERYNDNIFLTRSDRENDFITILDPNINLKYTNKKNLDLNLNYGFKLRFYSDHDQLNDTSLKDTQYGNLRAQARPLNRVFIDIEDIYTRVPVDIRESTAPDNEFENMTEYNKFIISPYIRVPITSTFLLLSGYSYRSDWYNDEAGNDAHSNGAFVSITRQFPKGLSTSLHYSYHAYRPAITSDANIQTGTIEAKYQLLRHVSVLGRAGRSYIDLLGTPENEKVSNWTIEANYSVSSTETIRASYKNYLANQEIGPISDTGIESVDLDRGSSTTTGLTKTKKFDFDIIVKRKIQIIVNSYSATIEEINTDREDRITGLFVNLKKPLTSRLTTMLNGRFERQKFLPEDVKVKWYSLGYGLEYFLGSRIISGIRYTYSNRNSEIDEGDYHNNIFSLNAKLIF